MSDFLSETEGCDLLARLFKARGYSIQRNVLFREYGVEFHVDGWDPKARVGFEFLTSEDDDHIDLSLDEYQALATAQLKGELSLFIIDEVEPMSAADLTAQAHEFLDEVADALQARRTGRAIRKDQPTAKGAAARNTGGKRAAANKLAVPARKKPAKKSAKKPAKKLAKKSVKKPAEKRAKTSAKKLPGANRARRGR